MNFWALLEAFIPMEGDIFSDATGSEWVYRNGRLSLITKTEENQTMHLEVNKKLLGVLPAPKGFHRVLRK